MRVLWKMLGMWIMIFSISFVLPARADTIYCEIEATTELFGEGMSNKIIKSLSHTWEKDGKMRIETQGRVGKSVIIFNGDTLYFYFPDQKQAIKYNVEKEKESLKEKVVGFFDPRTPLQEVLGRLNAKRVGKDIVGSKICDLYISEQTPEIPEETLKEIDKESLSRLEKMAKLKIEIWVYKDKIIKQVIESSIAKTTMKSKNIKEGISIPDNFFEIPEGTEVVDETQPEKMTDTMKKSLSESTQESGND